MSSLEKYHDNFYELVFSILYLVKSLRNADITNITYIENVDYNDSNFQKKIFMVNEIIYVTGGGIRGFKDNQKWRVLQFYDNNGVYSYDIEPYNENGTPTQIKQLITPDRMRSIDEDKTTVTSFVFREKYENKFLLCVIYLCFVYCFSLMTEDIKDSLMGTSEFNKLMKTVISENMYLFNDLSFSENLKEKIELIMVTIQKSILKQFNIDSDKLIGLMNYDPKKLMTLLGNYKLKFTNTKNTNNTTLKTDLYNYYESCDIFKLPELPTDFQVLYNTNTKSNNINLFNILCTAFHIEPDAMLSVARYNLNNTLNDINNFNSNKSTSLTGLKMEEIMKEKVEIPNVFNKALTMRAGKKKIRKTKNNKKKYKGGVVLVSMIGSAALGTTFYIAAADYAAFVAAGYVSVGSGLTYFAGGTMLMTAGTVAATTTTAVGTGTAVGAVATGVAGIAVAPLVVAVAGIVGLSYWAFGETAEQTIYKMYEGKTQLEKMNVLRERKANTEDLYDFEVEFEKKANEAIKKAQEAQEAREEINRRKAAEKAEQNRVATKAIEKISDIAKNTMKTIENNVKDMKNEYKWNKDIKTPPYKSTHKPNIGFSSNPDYAEMKWYKDIETPPYESTYKPNIGTSPNFQYDYQIEPHSLPIAPTPIYTQFNDNLLDSYNNNLPLTSPNNMDPAVPMFGAAIGIVALGYIGVKITKGVIGALKKKKEKKKKEKRKEEEEKIKEEEEKRKEEEEKIKEEEEKKFNPYKDYSYLMTKNSNTSGSNTNVWNTNTNHWNTSDLNTSDLNTSDLKLKRYNGGKKIRRTKRKKYNRY
jgi:hypothetical protein